MADRQRVYHPVTGEPFDVPDHKAIELRLEQGWLSHPLDPEAVPYVTTVQSPAPVAESKSPRRVIGVGREFSDPDEEADYAESIGMVPRGGGRQ